MRILLLQPSQYIVIGKKKKYGSVMPPLGLLMLISCIREKCPGVEVDFFDYEADNNQKTYPNYSLYDMIGISGTSVHMPHVNVIAKEIRTVNTKACVFIGGPHATFAYKQILENVSEIDAVITGEGEISVVHLINNYKGRNSIPEFPGIITRETTKFMLSPIVKDLDQLPEFAYDVININRYQLSTHRKSLKTPFVSFITSRGCPFMCNYCQTPNMFGNRIRYRTPKLVYNELDKLKTDLKYSSIVFWDDTFTSSREYTISLCSYLKALNVNWMCNTRVDRVDLELLNEMKIAGCNDIFFGVESFNAETLRQFNRSTTEDAVKQAFSFCKQVGIKTVASIMLGAPTDNLVSIEENVNKLIELSPDDVYISIYNATVGSKMFEFGVKSGIIDVDINWFDQRQFNGPPYGLPTICTALNRRQLQTAQNYAYRKFYGKDNEKQYD